MTDYLARAMEQRNDGEARETVPELEAETLEQPGAGSYGAAASRLESGAFSKMAEKRWRSDASQIEALSCLTSGAFNVETASRAGSGVLKAEVVGRPVAGVSGAEGGLPLLTSVRKAQIEADFAQGQRRAFSVTLPEPPPLGYGFTTEELDRAVERDARRYDGGFPLY